MKNKALNLRISEKRLNILRAYALDRDKTMTAIVEEWIDSLSQKTLPAIHLNTDSKNSVWAFSRLKVNIISEDILGKDGEKYIAKDANALKERQAQMMEQMQTMAPLMENAKDLLKTFESSGMMKLVDRFMPMIEQVALPGTTGAKN